jgi:hypothetical protein
VTTRRRWNVAVSAVLAAATVGAAWGVWRTRVDLCGVGPVALPLRLLAPDLWPGHLLPRRLGAEARAAAWPQVLAQLQAGTTPQQQAAALMLRIDGFVDAEAPDVPATGPQEDRPALTAKLVQMARHAHGAEQADIVRWAVQACRRHKQAAGCAGLSPRDVLGLDPTDGLAWLGEAAIRPGDRAALLRSATAPGLRFRDWSDALPAVVAGAMPDALPPYLLVDLVVLVVGIDAARQDSTGWELLMHCRPEALGDPTRRADCQALAEALTTRSDSLVWLSVGRALATRLGWPSGQLEALQAQEAAALNAHAARFDERQPYTCASIDRLRAWKREKARWGDMGALRR